VIGGALGGLNTANPIFSVFTSALGQMLDQFAAAAQETGAALRDPITNFQKIADAGLLASKAQEHYISRLIEVGRITEATAVIQGELVKKIGVSGVNDLTKLGESSDKLAKAWAELNLQMQAALAGPLAGLLEWITAVVKLGNQGRSDAARIRDIRNGLSGKDRQEFDRRSAGITDLTRRGLAFGGITLDEAAKRQLALAQEYAGRSKPQQIRPTAIDPKALQDAADKQLAAAERAEALRRQGLQLDRQAQDLRLQIEDQAYSFRKRADDLERATLDLRRSVEDEIFRKRQDVTRLEADNARQQAQLAIERLDLQLSGSRVSGNVPGQDLANGLLDAVRQYVKTRSEAEANLQQRERLHTIEIEELKRASEKFRFDVARKVSELDRQGVELNRDIERAKITTARAIYDLQVQAADYQLARMKEAISLMTNATQQLAATGDLTGTLTGGKAQSGGAFGKWDPALLRATGQLDQKYKVPLGTTASLVMFESSGNTAARGPDVGGGDRGHGLFQVMRGTAKELGVNHQSILGMGGVAQIGLLDKYLSGRGFRPGMNPEQMYATVLGGNPWARSADLNGTTPGSGAAVQRGWRGSAAAAITAAGGPASGPVPVTVVGATPTAAAPALPASVGTATSQLGGIKLPSPTDVSALLTSLSQLDQKLLSAKTNALEMAKAFTQLNKEQAAQVLGQAVTGIVDQLNAPLDQLIKSQKDAAAFQREYAGLIAEGTTPALAEQVAKIREQVRLQLEQLDTAVAQLEATKTKLEAEGKWTEELQKQLDLLKEQRGIIEGKGRQAEGFARGEDAGKRIRDYITKLQTELNDTEGMILSLAGTIESEIGSAMSNAITGVITGTMTVQQAMSTMFANIGKAFIDMATQMIAKALIMKVLGIFTGGLTGGGFGGFSGAGPYAMPGGGGFAGGFTLPKLFADGGFVTGPTPAVVGEAGSEYVIPASKMPEAMGRYAAGRRGSSVIPDSSAPGGGGAGGSGHFTLETVVINNVEYATVEQVRAMGRQSAQQGAAGGHSRVMGDLRNRRSTRSRLGLA
jgi:hypothetical protein